MGKYIVELKEGERRFPALNREGVDIIELAQRKQEYNKQIEVLLRDRLGLDPEDEVEIRIEWLS